VSVRCRAAAGRTRDLGRGSGCDDVAPFFTCTGTDVDDVVAGRYHSHIVLDNNHAIARFD